MGLKGTEAQTVRDSRRCKQINLGNSILKNNHQQNKP